MLLSTTAQPPLQVCNKKEKGICCSDGAEEEREVEPESESIESQGENIFQRDI